MNDERLYETPTGPSLTRPRPIVIVMVDPDRKIWCRERRVIPVSLPGLINRAIRSTMA